MKNRNQPLRGFLPGDFDEIIAGIKKLVEYKSKLQLYPDAESVCDILAMQIKPKPTKTDRQTLGKKIMDNIHRKGQHVKTRIVPLYESLDLYFTHLWVVMQSLNIPFEALREKVETLIEIKSIENAIKRNDTAILSSSFPAYMALSTEKEVIHELDKLKIELTAKLRPQKEDLESPRGENAKLATIPAENRTAPTTLKRMAELWGGDMTAKKLKGLINSSKVKAISLNRQLWIFDTSLLPGAVLKKVKI